MAEQKKNDRNNVFISEKARKKLLEKFIIKKNKKNKEWFRMILNEKKNRKINIKNYLFEFLAN